MREVNGVTKWVTSSRACVRVLLIVILMITLKHFITAKWILCNVKHQLNPHGNICMMIGHGLWILQTFPSALLGYSYGLYMHSYVHHSYALVLSWSYIFFLSSLPPPSPLSLTHTHAHIHTHTHTHTHTNMHARTRTHTHTGNPKSHKWSNCSLRLHLLGDLPATSQLQWYK